MSAVYDLLTMSVNLQLQLHWTRDRKSTVGCVGEELLSSFQTALTLGCYRLYHDQVLKKLGQGLDEGRKKVSKSLGAMSSSKF